MPSRHLVTSRWRKRFVRERRPFRPRAQTVSSYGEGFGNLSAWPTRRLSGFGTSLRARMLAMVTPCWAAIWRSSSPGCTVYVGAFTGDVSDRAARSAVRSVAAAGVALGRAAGSSVGGVDTVRRDICSPTGGAPDSGRTATRSPACPMLASRGSVTAATSSGNATPTARASRVARTDRAVAKLVGSWRGARVDALGTAGNWMARDFAAYMGFSPVCRARGRSCPLAAAGPWRSTRSVRGHRQIERALHLNGTCQWAEPPMTCALGPTEPCRGRLERRVSG